MTDSLPRLPRAAQEDDTVYIGIDDTDMPETPGTNQLARAIVAELNDDYRCRFILRHQLLFDPRVPYTSKNGSASIWLVSRDTRRPVEDAQLARLIDRVRSRMNQWYIPGSDPGLCVARRAPSEIIAFALRCQQEIVAREEAEQLAARHHVHLEGLGGTRGGMIGALAAVGLAATGNDGRVVVLGEWPDDLCGPQPLEVLAARGLNVRCLDTLEPITAGIVDVGKHLRPNLRDAQVVQFVRPSVSSAIWDAVRCP